MPWPPGPFLNIAGSGVPGAAAIWNAGGAQSNLALYATVNLTADATIGTPVRYELNGGTGGLNFNAGTFTLQLVGTGEKWWGPNTNAVLNDVFVRHGRFGVQTSNNMASDVSITNSAVYVLPAGELATFGDAITNTKTVFLSGGTLASTGGGGANGQFWRGGVSLGGNSYLDNRGTATANQLTIDNVDPSVAPLVLNNLTLEKLGSSGLLVLANTGASATGTGAGTLRIYNGNVTLQNGFIMDGAGQVRLQNFGQLNLNNTGIAPVLTKEVKLDGGTLNNQAGNNSAGAIIVGAYGRIFNNAAGTTLSLGNITVPSARGVQFGTTGSVVLSTINGAAPVVGVGNRLGVDFTAGATPATAGFATWNGSVVGVLPATVSNPVSPVATDDGLFTGTPPALANSDLTINTIVSGANVVIATTRLLSVASGGIVMRGAAHSINTPAAGTGRLTTGAADGRLVINSISVSDVTRIHNQNGTAAITGLLRGTGTLQHTGNNNTWIVNPASTFSGVNEFGFRDQTGQIQILVAKLANGGQPSSLGASSSAASNLVFNINPILRYVGIGDSTDRLFTLAGGFNINATPGAIIDGSGYGALNFTNTGNIEFGPGSYRQLTLRASTLSTGATVVGGALPLNVFAPNLSDPADHGFGQLVKDGIGRWAITANHTYSGTTAVNDGILILGNGGTTGMFGNGAGGLGPNQVAIVNNAAVHLNRTDSYTIPGRPARSPSAAR